MRQESVVSSDIDKTSETNLSDDGTEFTRGGRDTVTGRSVSSGEDLSGNDESGGVGTEVLEEVGHAAV